MYRFRVPELFLGCLLTVAVFAIGMLFEGQKQPASPTQTTSNQEAASARQKTQGPDAELTGSTWLTKDAAGFFTFGLVWVGLGQAVLFFVQLRYMRTGMSDATIAANAAKESADTAREALHASHRAWVTSESIADSDLTWDEKGCRLVIKTTIKNIGTTPAQNVDIQAKIYARPNNKPVEMDEILQEPRSKAIGHLLFPNVDLSPSRRLVLTREEIAASSRSELVIHIAVIVRYHSIAGQKEGRTVRLYDVQQVPGEPEEEAIVTPVPIRLDESVRQDRVWLSYHFRPSYAD